MTSPKSWKPSSMSASSAGCCGVIRREATAVALRQEAVSLTAVHHVAAPGRAPGIDGTVCRRPTTMHREIFVGSDKLSHSRTRAKTHGTGKRRTHWAGGAMSTIILSGLPRRT